MKQLLIRSISGLVFLALIVSAILVHPIYFLILFALIVGICMHEYLHMSLGNSYTLEKLLAIISGVSLFVLSFYVSSSILKIEYLLIPLIPLILIYISLLYNKNDNYKIYPYLMNSVLYCAIPFSMTTIILFDSSNEYMLLSLFIILWSSDVGAYLFGMAFGQNGKHKLFPSISPKKSWEGYFGSLICSLLAGFLLYKYDLINISFTSSLIIAVLINVFGALGDLVESQLKRNFGVKDSGKIMPGHGGLLDRFDGALLSFPIAIIYLILI
ncbi:MAG: phosphatidate cytidylyltransferase [Bacteroidales bacterium]